jgi:hypothetical protein
MNPSVIQLEHLTTTLFDCSAEAVANDPTFGTPKLYCALRSFACPTNKTPSRNASFHFGAVVEECFLVPLCVSQNCRKVASRRFVSFFPFGLASHRSAMPTLLFILATALVLVSNGTSPGLDASRCLRDAILRRDWLSHSLPIFCCVSGDVGGRVLAESHDPGAAAKEAKADAAFEDVARTAKAGGEWKESDPSTILRKTQAATTEKAFSTSERSTKGARHEVTSEQQRRLEVTVSGSTVGAPWATGNPTCSDRANGGSSKTYTVVGTGGPMVASTCASNCASNQFNPKIIVYNGSSCASLTCIGELHRGK